jgi:immune inhibitor A
VTETENRTLSLQDVKTGFKTHRLWTNGDTNSQEYFLIENRQTTGSDEYLPGKGLLIWHIDDSVWSNTDENHPKVKLMQADGLEQLKFNLGRGDAGDVYPGDTNNPTFDSQSRPDSKSYSGANTYVSVTKIPLPAVTMTFEITVRQSGQPPTGDFNPMMWYRLKNTYQPATHCLDVINDNGTDSTGLLQMAADGRYSGQHWQLKSNGNGSYRLRTLFLGPNRQLSVKDDKKTPVLQTANPLSTAQSWLIGSWGDGTWHFEVSHSHCRSLGPADRSTQNEWLQKHLYLDTMEGGPKVEMNAANAGRPTQRWTIEPIREITEAGF